MSSARRVELDGVVGVWVPVDDAVLLASAAGRWNEERARVGQGRHRRLAVVRDEVLAAVRSPVSVEVLAGADTGRVMVDPATAAALEGVSVQTVTRRARDGLIPGAVKLGRGRAGRWAVPCAPSATTNDDDGVNLP